MRIGRYGRMCGREAARLLLAGAITAGLAGISVRAQTTPLPAPRTIDALRAARGSASLQMVRTLDDGPSYRAHLVSYRSGTLLVYAMVAVPTSVPPERGFPVLVANHGTHPDPPKYGITKDGVDARPGDYYRPVPELYTRRGFLVVLPDYRGHNASEGREYAKGFLASAYFTEDVLALVSALGSIDHADVGNVFMWGHSLGGEVTLRALLATGVVKGASLWSTVGGDVWDQAYYYSRSRNPEEPDGSGVDKPRVTELKAQMALLSPPYDWTAAEPLRHLRHLRTPIILHHARGDTGARYEWSERLAKELYLLGLPYVFHTYSGSDHFFAPDVREQAADRDAAFFRSLMNGSAGTARR